MRQVHSDWIRLTKTVMAVFCAVLFQVSVSRAEGVRIYGMSAEGQARGEAVVASINDASAVWYNPGALTSVGPMDVVFNLNQTILKAKYTDLSGNEEKSQRSYFPLPSLYVGSNLHSEKWAVGLGINTPFGLATEYSKTSAFRYSTTGGEINLINVNPTVAYQLHPKLSMGMGLDYYYSTVELRQQYPWALFGSFPDGSVTIQGQGDGLGFNLGFLAKPLEQHSIGLTYRSQVVVKYSGRKAELSNVPSALQGSFPSGTGDLHVTGSKIVVTYPDMLALGYAYKPSDKWVWELGFHWTNWNDFKSLNIDLDQPNAFLPNSSTPLNWKNSYAVRMGFKHHCTENFAWSGGYFYNESPTVDSTYTPLLPDGNHHVFSTGAEYRYNNFTFKLPLVGGFQTGRGSVSNSAANVNGSYDLYLLQIGLHVAYAF